MNNREKIEIIQQIIINSFNWITDKDCVTLQSRLREDLELDSLAIVNLQVQIEDEFGIKFDPIDTDLADVFETVGSLVQFLDKVNPDKEI